MKKVLIALLMLTALSAHADYWHRGYGGRGLLPLVIGGVIGYEIARPRHDTVIIQQQQPVQQGVMIDGILYVEVLQYFQDCNCYKKVLVPKQ